LLCIAAIQGEKQHKAFSTTNQQSCNSRTMIYYNKHTFEESSSPFLLPTVSSSYRVVSLAVEQLKQRKFKQKNP
jgi:hypothetical protein